VHLPPAYILELPEEEIVGNAMVKKLTSSKLLGVKKAESIAAEKSALKKGESDDKAKEFRSDKKESQPDK
jgi:hypothetical protein